MGLTETFKVMSVEHPNLAYFLALISYVSLAILQIIFKFIVKIITPHQALFYRAISLLAINSYFLRRNNYSAYISNPRCTCQ